MSPEKRRADTAGPMTHFPQAVPEIPVSNVDKAAEYYVNVLGFSFDWGNDAGGIGGISQGHCRMFLTNAPFRGVHGPKSPVIIWLNLNSKQEVDENSAGSSPGSMSSRSITTEVSTSSRA